MIAIHYKATLEQMLGVKLKRCRIGAGSMRNYIMIRISAPFAPIKDSADSYADSRARNEWIGSRVGFAPFFTSREYNGDICADLRIGAIKMPAEEVQP